MIKSGADTERGDRARGAQTRERIVRATIEQIAEAGWDGVRIRDVAARAEVNLALVHYHFGSKRALMLGALDASVAEQMAAPVGDLEAAPSPAEALRGLVALATTIDLAAPTARVMHEAVLAAVREPEIGEHVRPALMQARGLVEQALGAILPAWAPEDAEALAIALTALVDGLILHRVLDPDLPAERVARALTGLIMSSDAAMRDGAPE